jgi:hypothetical protein
MSKNYENAYEKFRALLLANSHYTETQEEKDDMIADAIELLREEGYHFSAEEALEILQEKDF